MNRIRICALMSMLVLLAGCATNYQERNSWTGVGYTDTRIDSNTVKVSYRGNSYTAKEKVENYLLYRAAEVTSQYGYDYFILRRQETVPFRGSYQTSGTYTETTSTKKKHGKNYVTKEGHYTPGTEIPYEYFEASATVKMFNGVKPQRPNAYDAREVLSYMSEKVLSNSRY